MTGLERVTLALDALQHRRQRLNETLGYEFVGEYIDPAKAELDAHLRKDAEREQKADEFASIIQDKLVAQAAELTELREAVRAALDWWENDMEWRGRMDTFEDLMERLRQLIEEKP